MTEEEPQRPDEPKYEPPRLVRLGNLRELKKKSTPSPDQTQPNAPHPQRP
jgi:hypothetical protein